MTDSPQEIELDRMAAQLEGAEKPSVSSIKLSTDHVEQNSLKAPSVDTLHNDEAMRVFAQDHGDDAWSPLEEKRLLRKLDWRLLPLLCFTYVTHYTSQQLCHRLTHFSDTACNIMTKPCCHKL